MKIPIFNDLVSSSDIDRNNNAKAFLEEVLPVLNDIQFQSSSINEKGALQHEQEKAIAVLLETQVPIPFDLMYIAPLPTR
jgi:hypothetical protein